MTLRYRREKWISQDPAIDGLYPFKGEIDVQVKYPTLLGIEIRQPGDRIDRDLVVTIEISSSAHGATHSMHCMKKRGNLCLGEVTTRVFREEA